jgi:hypothetical protein
MSSLATIIKDESLASTLRIGVFGLAACSIVGVAAYIGYKAAGPNKSYTLHNRPPESNDQVKNKYLLFENFKIYRSDATKLINHTYPFSSHVRMIKKCMMQYSVTLPQGERMGVGNCVENTIFIMQ